MTMTEWAEEEVRIACERERNGSPENEWDYGCACYKSALKAYKSLMEDGHSGMSFSLTASVLKNLLDGRPLTPILDEPEIWNPVVGQDDIQCYQCTRRFSLFKNVYPDGAVSYEDSGRWYGVMRDGTAYHSRLIDRVMKDEVPPIAFPYEPLVRPIKVYTDDFLFGKTENAGAGDFDTVGINYAVFPDGSRKEIHRFFKETDALNTIGGFEEITAEEYCKRADACGADISMKEG